MPDLTDYLRYSLGRHNRLKLYLGNTSEILRLLPSNSVHFVVTSPPYWGLRRYDDTRKEMRGSSEIGNEKLMSCGKSGLIMSECGKCHICNLTRVFKECKRIIRNDGCIIIVYDNPYMRTVVGNREGQTAKLHKEFELITATYELVYALRRVGLGLREELIWEKSNPKPDSVSDRSTKATERILKFTKSGEYYYDKYATMVEYYNKLAKRNQLKNRTDVITTSIKKDWSGEHKGTFPEELVHELFKGCYAPYKKRTSINSAVGACSICSTSYHRITEKRGGQKSDGGDYDKRDHSRPYNRDGTSDTLDGIIPETVHIGWKKTCRCNTEETIPCTVLDPFMGSGTVAVVALKNRLNSIGVDLVERYYEMDAIPRIEKLIREDRYTDAFVEGVL